MPIVTSASVPVNRRRCIREAQEHHDVGHLFDCVGAVLNVGAGFSFGEIILLHYTGLVQVTPAFAAAAVRGGETEFDEQYMRMSMTFDTGAAQYRWLTQSLFVAEGRIAGPSEIPASQLHLLDQGVAAAEPSLRQTRLQRVSMRSFRLRPLRLSRSFGPVWPQQPLPQLVRVWGLQG